MERRPIQLTPAQETLVHLPTQGQFLVRGAAGSGKSTVALARALHLARQPLLHGAPRVLLLARAPALAAGLRELRDASGAGGALALDVDSLAAWCRALLSRDGAPREPLPPAQAAALVEAALELVRRRSRSQVLRRPVSFFTTEIESMLLGLGAERFEDYVPVEREGRVSPLDDEARRAVYSVYEGFRALARQVGKAAPLVLVGEAWSRVASERRPPYDHVVVDDAHRLAPIELKLVRALAAGGSLTLFAALEQRFDPLAASLRDLGLGRLDRAEVLLQAMRGPAPIFAAALAVLRRRGAEGAHDLRTILPGTIEGQRPRLLLCSGWQDELDALASEVTRLGAEGRRLGEIAVLCASGAGLDLSAAALSRAGIASRRLDDEIAEPRADAVALCPLAAAAGREFQVVLVLDVNRGSFPRLRASLAEHERPSAESEARRALYLAMTRATEELVLLATEASRSPLLPMKKLAVERSVAAQGAVRAAGA